MRTMEGIKAVFENFVRKAQEKAAQRELPSHLEDDGLMHCDICRAPIQCRVNIFEEERIMPCICDCEKAERARIEEEKRKAEIMENIRKLRSSGFDSSEMQRWRFEADDGKQPDATRVSKNYVKNFDKLKPMGKGLLFCGTVGTGKSFQAACIANALIDQNIPVLMTRITRIVNDLQNSFAGRNEYIDRLNRYDLLILDDLEAERNTEYVNEITFEVIDGRYRSGKPLIITTNLTHGEMLSEQDIKKMRVYSRILERCYPYEIKGLDRRKASHVSDFAEMKKLLEG